MTDEITPTLADQLSAWMDGELPPDQARFLQRRLDADPALRAQFERWQVASACLRGQRVAAMPATLGPAIAAAIDREPKRRSPWPWLATAAALALVAVLLPGRPVIEPGPAPLAGSPSTSPVEVVTDPASSPATMPAPIGSPAPGDSATPIADLPLADVAPKPWPRSPLAADDRQLEAYLVGHNTLMAQDGLGGFMPYVDVVAHGDDAPAIADEAR